MTAKDKHQFIWWNKRRRGEFWMEYGKVIDHNYHDMYWYNEGNGNEWRYFLRGFAKHLWLTFTFRRPRKMFFKAMVWHINFCVHI